MEKNARTNTTETGECQGKNLIVQLSPDVYLMLYFGPVYGEMGLEGCLNLGDSLEEQCHFFLVLDSNWQEHIDNPWFWMSLKNEALYQMAVDGKQNCLVENADVTNSLLGMMETFLRACAASLEQPMLEGNESLDTDEPEASAFVPQIECGG